MDHSELLAHVAQVFDAIGVRYFVTGSMATFYYGEPRTTNDIDVVAVLGEQHIPWLVRAFPFPPYYVSEEAARDAIRRKTQFNIIHSEAGLKIDVMIPADDAFNRSRLARSVHLQPIPDRSIPFASIEDVILKKMEYYREGGSVKHIRDINGVLKMSGQRIDRAYIADWATQLGVKDIWDRIVLENDKKS